MLFETDRPAFHFHPGYRPLLISMPHVGTYVPPRLRARLTDAAQQVPDTDWHLEALYGFAQALGASVLVATHSRYVIDLNRPADNANLYPGQDTTGLCPIDTFDKQALYRSPDDLPGPAEIAARCEALWQPYHQQLQQSLQALRTRFGRVALWDAHSIRSQVPRFFQGRLPDLNLGTADGKSCDPRLADTLLALARASGMSAVLNGRFKGGYITRQYGQPEQGIHAVQLEMAQITYMDETPPYRFCTERAAQVQPCLQVLLRAALDHVQG
ncbi:MAG: N-formylglutamate deformylase [Limnohabitans sp.]